MTVGSRREFLVAGGLSAGVALLGARALGAGDDGVVQRITKDAATASIVVQHLRRDIDLLRGSGGNVAVLSGPDGKVLVDAGLSVSRPRVSDALASINSDPIRHLINTHWHFDHTDGNAWLHASGASIVAHENTKRHMATATRVDAWDYTFPVAPSGALPEAVFSLTYRMHLNNTSLLLKHYPPAHTDSDLSVTFGEADVLHVGDTWWNGSYPFIDYSTGGSIDGTIRAAGSNLAVTTNNTLIVPGYGPVGGRGELSGFHEMLLDVREKVAALKKAGRSLSEAVAARPTSAYDATWGRFIVTPAEFIGLVYQGV
ncbi:MBL fold metallo-hydrolase [Granulicella sibirica]|uniref:Cyclase n=1 Tax=Granulicella sibirica TaxID=2479048 RepID=A0A4Q0T8D2_9BACT|nr:MBL fold metallo-hydrolase [Granulicella sibirica]RXH57871.1 Cyclase [Granulicella sibirica]